MANSDMEMIDIWSDIGSTAGEIYRGFVGTAQPFHLQDIMKKVRKDEVMIKMALGWLSREGKIKVTRDTGGFFQFQILS